MVLNENERKILERIFLIPVEKRQESENSEAIKVLGGVRLYLLTMGIFKDDER